jgi:phosphocarrier protein
MVKNESEPGGNGDTQRREVVVSSPNGLHARPAGKLAQAAQKFSASVSIASGEQVVDAKSILDILTLAVGEGTTLELRASGDDAPQALDRLERLFENRFREE